jgi:hypothetical protein
MATVKVIRKLRLLFDVVFTRPDASAVQDGDVLTYVLADDKFYPAAPGGGGGGAPTTLDYLVGTASGSLSNEIVAGATPGGELGGTWGSPTVDATHSGSSHADVQAAAETTAANALNTHVTDAADAHDASAVSIVDVGTFYTGTEVEAALQEIGAALAASGSGESVVQEVTQNGHALSVGDWVKRSGGAYALALADSAANAEVYGVVSAVLDANNFELTTHGLVTGLSGLTADVPHFLSPSTPGDITATPPATPGEISKPVLLALTTTTGVVVNMRGMVVGGAGGDGLVWTPMAYAASGTPWSDFGSGYFPVEYAKDANWVYIRGMALSNAGELEPWDPLPVGYRPSSIAWIVGTTGGGQQKADVNTDGSIVFFGGVATTSCWFNERIPL